MLPSPTPTHRHMHLDTPTSTQTLAVFAAHLATSCRFCHPHCRFLPLLPPITRNVKLLRAANPLEFGIRAENVPDTRPKGGKNGNVNHRGQHCRIRVRDDGRRGRRPSRREFIRRPVARTLPVAYNPLVRT